MTFFQPSKEKRTVEEDEREIGPLEVERSGTMDSSIAMTAFQSPELCGYSRISRGWGGCCIRVVLSMRYASRQDGVVVSRSATTKVKAGETTSKI